MNSLKKKRELEEKIYRINRFDYHKKTLEQIRQLIISKNYSNLNDLIKELDRMIMEDDIKIKELNNK